MTGDLNGIGAEVEDAAYAFDRLSKSLVAACFEENQQPRPGLVRLDCQDSRYSGDLDGSLIGILRHQLNSGDGSLL